MLPWSASINGEFSQRHGGMAPFWRNVLMLKDSTDTFWSNSFDLIGWSNLQVTIEVSSLDIPERILETSFLDHRILGRLMISTPLFI